MPVPLREGAATPDLAWTMAVEDRVYRPGLPEVVPINDLEAKEREFQ